ncbi:MAG: Hsp20/alpha crystallin family protein [Clostridia bacterium]|nr:Hsp20/alpha crystallin family protein [Clostridia bacterium]
MYQITRRLAPTPFFFSPFRDLELFDRAFFTPQTTSFKTDVTDKGDFYLVETDLPGFAREDIKLSLVGDILTVKAEKSNETEEKDDDGRVIRRERSLGSYSRSFDVGEVDTESIKAKYENGVLTLTLPKKQELKPEERLLEIE